MLIVLLFASAFAECPSSVGVEQWTKTLNDLRAEAFAGAQGADKRLDALRDEAPCVDGPLETADIAALWLARGAWDVLADQVNPNTRAYFANARAVGGDSSWDQTYGPDVKAWFDASTPSGPPASLFFYLPNEVLVVDGVVIYEAAPVNLPAGEHLVQWSKDGVWSGRWITLLPAEPQSLGTAPIATVAEAPPPKPRTESGRQVDAQLGAGIVLMSADVLLVDAQGAERGFQGTDSSTLASVELRVGGPRVFARASAISGRAPTSADLAWPRNLGLSAGVRGTHPNLQWSTSVGGALTAAPLNPSDSWLITNDVDLDVVPTWTAVARVDARIGGRMGLQSSLDAQVGPSLGSVELGAGPSLALNDALSLQVVGTLGAMSLLDADGSLRWFTVTGGTQWSF